MTVGKDVVKYLRPVVECARDELSDMDPDEVPSALRKIARSSARTLPPPFARSVVQRMIDDPVFREAVGERYVSDGSDDPALTLFLSDPQSGLDAIAAAVELSRTEREAEMLDAANRRVKTLVGRLSDARTRADDVQRRHLEELESVRLSGSEGLSRAVARNTELRSVVSQREFEVAELAETAADLREELKHTRERIDHLTDRIRRRAGSIETAAQPPRAVVTPSDPIAHARWLDDLERSARPFRSSTDQGRSADPSGPLVLPAGVPAESSDMIAALVAQSPTKIIIDGYNVAGEIYGEGFSTRIARDDVVDRAGRLARRSEAEVLVVFDGAQEGEGDGFRSSAGVSVRFSRGETADDMIVDVVHASPARTVVVTNDRELAERCSIDGCVLVLATAFVGWR